MGFKTANYRGGVYVAGLRLRALVEVILGSAMRISEVLSLNRDQIDFKQPKPRLPAKAEKTAPCFLRTGRFTGLNSIWQRGQMRARRCLFARTERRA